MTGKLILIYLFSEKTSRTFHAFLRKRLRHTTTFAFFRGKFFGEFFIQEKYRIMQRNRIRICEILEFLIIIGNPLTIIINIVIIILKKKSKTQRLELLQNKKFIFLKNKVSLCKILS